MTTPHTTSQYNYLMASTKSSTTSHIASALPIATLQLYYMNVGQIERKDVQGLFPVFHAHLQDDAKSKLTRKESIVHKIKKRIFSKSKKRRTEEVPQPASRPTPTVLYSAPRPALDMTEARMESMVADHAALDSLLSLEALSGHAGHEEATQQVTKAVTSTEPPHTIRALKSTAIEETHVEPVLEASLETHSFLPFRLFDDETVVSESPNPTVPPIPHDKDDVAEQSTLNPPTTEEDALLAIPRDKDDVAEQSALNPPTTEEDALLAIPHDEDDVAEQSALNPLTTKDDALLDATSSIEEEFFSAAEHVEKGGLFTHAPSKDGVSEHITKGEEVAKLSLDGVSPICKPLVVAVASLGVFAMLVPIMSRLFRR